MRSAAVFVLKSAAFSVIFCAVAATIGLFVFSASNSVSRRSSGGAAAAQTQQDESAALLKKYWAQAAEADALQQSQKAYLTESALQLRRWEGLLNRWDTIMQRLEKLPAK